MTYKTIGNILNAFSIYMPFAVAFAFLPLYNAALICGLRPHFLSANHESFIKNQPPANQGRLQIRTVHDLATCYAAFLISSDSYSGNIIIAGCTLKACASCSARLFPISILLFLKKTDVRCIYFAAFLPVFLSPFL